VRVIYHSSSLFEPPLAPPTTPSLESLDGKRGVVLRFSRSSFINRDLFFFFSLFLDSLSTVLELSFIVTLLTQPYAQLRSHTFWNFLYCYAALCAVAHPYFLEPSLLLHSLMHSLAIYILTVYKGRILTDVL